MNEFETLIWKAVHEADLAFEKDHATGTKTWMRDYLLPSLERHGLELRKKEVAATPEKADLGKVGLSCDDCGAQSADVRATTCPFNAEINNKTVDITVCDKCYQERLWDI